MSTTRVFVLSLLALALCVGMASAADHPAAAKKLSIKNRNGKQKLVLSIEDAGIGFPEASSGDDPRTASMDLELFSGSGESAVLSMPDSGWKLKGNSWLFKNRDAPDGISPVRLTKLTEGKGLKVVSRGAGLLPTGSLQSAAVRLVSGTVRTCAVFGKSTVRRDAATVFLATGADSSGLADCTDDSLGVSCAFNTETLDCAGICAGDTECALTDPLGQGCSCVDPADPCGDTAPLCSGTCPPGETCTSYGSAITPNCGCIPDGTEICGGVPGVCGGECPEATVCVTVFESPSLGGDPYCTCGAPGSCSVSGGSECPAGFGCALIPGSVLCAPVGCPGDWSYPSCGGDCGDGASCNPIDVLGYNTCVCSREGVSCDGACAGYECAPGQACLLDESSCICGSE